MFCKDLCYSPYKSSYLIIFQFFHVERPVTRIWNVEVGDLGYQRFLAQL